MNYFRQVDTVFDVLASLGGLYSALSLIFSNIVSLLQFYGFYQFVMFDLFTDTKKSKQ